MSKTKNTVVESDLPPDIRKSDLDYPKMDLFLDWESRKNYGLENLYTLNFYRVKGLGWVICTLHISNPSRRQSSAMVARTYAIGVNDQKIYTVGKGPHVTKTVEVHLTKDNVVRMQKYVDLWRMGMEKAGQIRDRISTRRAQGQLRRSEW